VAGAWDSSSANFTLNGGTSTIQLTGANPNITTKGADSFCNLTITNGATLQSALTTTGAMNVTGGTLNSNNFNISVGGNWTIAGSGFTPGTGTVSFTGSGAQIDPGSSHFWNFYVYNNVTLLRDIFVDNNLEIMPSGVLHANTHKITLQRNWTNDRDAAGFAAEGGTVELVNPAIISIVSGSTTFNTLLSTAAGKTIQFQAGTTQTTANFTITGLLGNLITLTSTTNAAWTIKYTLSVSVSYAYIVWSDVDDTSLDNITSLTSADGGNNDTSGPGFHWIFSGQILTWLGTTSSNWFTATNWDKNYPPGAGDTVIIPLLGTINDPDLTGSTTIKYITIAKKLTITGCTLTVNGDVNVSATGTLDASAGGGVTLTGNWTNSGTFTAGTSTVTFSGSQTPQTVTSGGSNFYNISLSKSSSGQVVQLADALTQNAGGNAALHTGTIDQNGHALNLANVTIDGTVSIMNAAAGLSVSGTTTNTGTFTLAASTLATFTGNVANSGTLTGSASGVMLKFDAGFTNTGTLNMGTNPILFTSATAATISTGSSSLYDIYIDKPGATITLGSSVTCHQFVFYRGTLNINGKTLATTAGGGGDFVVFGAAYNAYDADMATTNPGNTLFAYPLKSSLLFDPGAPYASVFSDLSGSTITVGRSFYVNGTDMVGASDWSLVLPTTGAAPWGNPYAIAFNMNAAHSKASNAYVSAASSVTGPPAETNNNATDGGNNVQWDFSRPSILSAATVYDNVIHVTFSEPIKNSSNEISAVVAGIKLNGKATAFTGSFRDAACTSSTDGAGNLSDFYLKVSTTSWNTDATGLSTGAAASTNRSGVHQTVIPDISMLKGTLYDVANNRIRNYNYNTFADYTATTDQCKPVIVAITAATAAHEPDPIGNPGSYYQYDGHNYFNLQYSEAVNIGDLVIGATNVRSQVTFGAGQHGGDLTSTSGTATLLGYFSYPGTITPGSTDATPTANALYRSDAFNLRVYIAGYCTGASPAFLWPGYVSGVSSPVGQTATAAANANVVDLAAVPNAADSTTVTISGAGWDTDPPILAVYESGTPAIYDGYPMDTNGDGSVDRIEFHFLDDSTRSWDSATDHPDTVKGIRTSTLTAMAAFKIGQGDAALVPMAGTFQTSVNNPIFGAINLQDNPYFAAVPTSPKNLPLASDLWISYDSSVGHVTDLAGNLLGDIPSSAPDRLISRVPPGISLTLASVGQNKLYVQFSQRVWGPGKALLTPADFQFTGSNAISSIQPIDVQNQGIKDAFLILSSPLVVADSSGGTIAASPGMVFDQALNQMTTNPRRVTDIGLGVTEPVWASDGVHGGALMSGLLKAFDGTGKLMDLDITLEMAIESPGQESDPLQLYYDVGAAPSSIVGQLWLPVAQPGFTTTADTEARGLLPIETPGVALRDFRIPAADPEIKVGVEVEFVVKLGGLFCARLLDPTDPRTVAPWSFSIADIKRQRENVTILNNVINPGNGERTALVCVLPESGNVTVTVFNLAGEVVRILQRGAQGAGEYTYPWDGKNSGGNAVARGIYFIRVVGPGIDETRKVLVTR
jgi:hypothetical protein